MATEAEEAALAEMRKDLENRLQRGVDAVDAARSRAAQRSVSPEQRKQDTIVDAVVQTPAEIAYRRARRKARREKRYLGEDPSRKSRKEAMELKYSPEQIAAMREFGERPMETRGEVMDRVRARRAQLKSNKRDSAKALSRGDVSSVQFKPTSTSDIKIES